MQIDVLGIDLAKRVFQLHGVTSSGMAVHRSKVSRPSLLQAIERLCPRMVVMEACASAHHWARLLVAKGIVVKLISPQFVAPFVKTNKNDRNDAEHGAARHALRAVEPVDGAPAIAGGPGMSASAAQPMRERRPQTASPSNLRSANQRSGWRVCASCSINGSRDARSADVP